MCSHDFQIENRAHKTRTQNVKLTKAQLEEIDAQDFKGERKEERKRVERRALKLSEALEEYLKFKTRSMVRDITRDLKKNGKITKARKQGARTREEKKLLRLLMIFGVRQITDSGKEYAGSEWKIPPTFISDYLAEKEILIQRLDANIEKEFRRSVGRALAAWMKEDPSPTIQQLADRLKNVERMVSLEDSPQVLKPLGNRFTKEGLQARARMIARTEIGMARNYGRVEAGKLMGRTHVLWIASNDGKSGDRHHEALDGQIVKQGQYFKNPKTKARLRYPGDPKTRSKFGVAGEVINCRCSVRPITERMAKLLRRK